MVAFSHGLAVWVSACPCAFGLATPTAILVATGVAATNGLLFRKGSAMQHLSEVDTIALDKVQLSLLQELNNYFPLFDLYVR